MYYYAPDNNRKGKRAGLIAIACYLAVFAAISFLVTFQTDYERHSEDILIYFGGDTDGTGEQNVALSRQENVPHSASSPSTGELLTQDMEETPPITHSRRQSEMKLNNSDSGTENGDSNIRVQQEQQREVNRKALFPGRSTASNAASQGSAKNTAAKIGSETGADGSATGTGTGTEGISFDLTGRKPVGSLPKPAYESNEAQGIVIIEITVDAQGRVQTASFLPHGSTTQDAGLLESAMKAARQARFSPSEANAVQTGTVTYIFRLQ